MNGKISTNPIALPIEEKKAKQWSLQIKLALAILVSNLAIYLIMAPASDSGDNQKKAPILEKHAKHLMLALPIIAMLPLDPKAPEFEVDLVAQGEKAPLVFKAYLHPFEKNTLEQDESLPTDSLSNQDNLKSTIMLVEIPPLFLAKIRSSNKKTFLAYPAGSLPKLVTPKGGPHEIRL